MSRNDPLPVGLALLLLGIGSAGITFLSITEPDVSYARAQWTAALALILATPAIALYVLEEGPPGRWWRAFWTVGLAAYLAHVWWSVFRSYDGDVAAIIARQGWVAYTNFAVTLVWTLDVILAWAAPASAVTVRVALRFVTWAGVTISFLMASAFFRSGTIAMLGFVLAAIIVAALLMRYLRWVRWADSR
jgi:hypothetical protein